MSSDNSDLSPCPFCGGGETQVLTNYMPVKMGQKPEIISVEINHWCAGLIRGEQRRSVHAHGRDLDDAIAAWNRRFASFVSLPEVERLRAEIERLREALRDALDGLRYWVPQTSAGAVERSRIMEKGIEALEVKP